MGFINFNGKILKTGETATFDGRDGLFETMKIIDGKIYLEKFHFERLFHGFEVLKFNVPEFFLAEKLSEEVLELCKHNQCEQLARVRLSVSCNNEEGLNYLVECSALKIREELLTIDIFPDARKSCDMFSNLKSSNRLPYVMAEKFAKENNLDDALILNVHERICDSTIANVFWIKDGIIFTPPLSEGCVAGVMRKHLKAQGTRDKVQERPCGIGDLENADEIFLTNAIRGIRPVGKFAGRELASQQTQKLKQELNL